MGPPVSTYVTFIFINIVAGPKRDLLMPALMPTLRITVHGDGYGRGTLHRK
jgi:hypothetical protein